MTVRQRYRILAVAALLLSLTGCADAQDRAANAKTSAGDQPTGQPGGKNNGCVLTSDEIGNVIGDRLSTPISTSVGDSTMCTYTSTTASSVVVVTYIPAGATAFTAMRNGTASAVGGIGDKAYLQTSSNARELHALTGAAAVVISIPANTPNADTALRNLMTTALGRLP
ncbi:hypothetical protein [Dactylosporangium sp. NPDC048998]|uniref:hypothetical protein n=1 Tax=Dactylosporangium sp. NPDC048998 TaxID=3363976 RepID=UPI00371C64B7